MLQLYTPPPADACGVKLIVKSNGPRKAARKPIKAEESRPVIAARPTREPVAAGPPKQPDRRTVAAKPKTEPPPPAPTPAPPPPPATSPSETPPAPSVAATEPRETQPTPTPSPKPAPPVAPIKRQELYFGNNSSNVANTAALDRLARRMKSDPAVSVTIEGHADPRGNPDGNMKLSETRAERVRDYLVAAGIDASRLHVEAYGDTRLQYSKTDGRNRRVVILPK